MPSIEELKFDITEKPSITLRNGMWAAMDEDGGWYLYQFRPRIRGDEWYCDVGSTRRLTPDLFVLPKADDWRRSAFQIS